MSHAARRIPRRNGFTLIELLIVVAITVIVGVVAIVDISQRRVDTDLTSTAQEIATTLRQAQSDSMAVEGGTTWGVHFANSTATAPFYALFSGASYATGTVEGYYRLPSTVAYRSSSLPPGSSMDVVFSPVSGAVSGSGVGGPVPISLIQTASYAEQSGASYSNIAAQFGSSVATGDAIVVAIEHGAGYNVTGCSDANNPTSTYLFADSVENTYDGLVTEIWYAPNVAGGVNPAVTCQFGGADSYDDIAIQEFSGFAASGSLDATSTYDTESTVSSLWTTGTSTTSGNGELLFGAFQGNNGGYSLTPGSGFTKAVDNGAAANFTTIYGTQSSAGPASVAATSGGSTEQANAMATFTAATTFSAATIGLYMPNESAAFSSTITVSPAGGVSY